MKCNKKLIVLLMTTVLVLSSVFGVMAADHLYRMDYSKNDNLFYAINNMTTTTLTARTGVIDNSKSGDFEKYVYAYAIVQEKSGSSTYTRGLYANNTVAIGKTGEAAVKITKSFNQTMIKGYTKHSVDGGGGERTFKQYYTGTSGILVTPQ